MVWSATVAICSALIVTQVSAADYTGAKNVKQVSTAEWKQRERPALVQFFAPWCGHCRAFEQTFKTVASRLPLDVYVVDGDKDQQLAGQESVQGFPTIRLYVGSKHYEYRGAREAEALIDFVWDTLRKHSGSASKSSGGSKGGKGPIQLTDADFDRKIKEGIWLVEFFAPWCGHCKQLEPTYKQLAEKVHGDPDLDVHIAQVDATQERNAAQQNNIKGFPTIKLFKDGKLLEDYNGGRDLNSLLDFVKQHKPQKQTPSELRQLLSTKDIDECRQAPLCVLSFLPHLLDCDAKCRNKYIELLKKETDEGSAKGRGWLLLWSEGAVHLDLEDKLSLGPGIGYPSMAVVNGKRGKTAALRGSFSIQGIQEFLKGLVYGKASVQPLDASSLKLSEEQSPWDGKDFVQEEIKEEL